jgi:DNA-binding SARP family transcriptional activator
MGNAGLEFGVLGPLQLTAGGTLVPLGAPKQRAVLAMLVLNRNRPVSVDALIDAVWDQLPVPAARTSTHSYVSRLRGLIGAAGVDANQVLASAPPGYQLNVADADCDLGRFVTEKNAGVHAAAAGRFEDASGYLSAALAQWRGPFLDDLREFAFVDTFATALSEVRVAVQTALAEAEIACGRADAVIPRLEVLSVVIDTGGSFVTSDLRWTNGVQVQGRRIRSSATLADGDHIRIGGHEFTFDIRPR